LDPWGSVRRPLSVDFQELQYDSYNTTQYFSVMKTVFRLPNLDNFSRNSFQKNIARLDAADRSQDTHITMGYFSLNHGIRST